MKTQFLLLTGLFILIFHSSAQTRYERSWQKNAEKIRIISYNIMDGFDDLKDTDRIERFVDWIKEKDPEVLALQELVSFKEKDLKELAKKYGHPYVAILKEDGYPVGITSKKPIRIVNKFVEGYWHGFLHVETYDMDFIVLHLSPRGDSIRFDEAQKITAYIRGNCPDNVLVMGDFNSSSPFDADEMEQKPLRMQRLAASAARTNTNREMRHFYPDYSVQSTFLATPLADVCRLYVKPENRTTIPTRMLIENSKREDLHKVSGGRIDYILLSYPLLQKCVDAFIWNGEDTDYLSDHYPVGVDMLLLHNTEN